MSNIAICHNKLTAQPLNNAYREYYSIPVALIKAVLTYIEKPKLNHFERVILELLIGNFYTPDELKDILMVRLDLIEMVLNSMKNKNLIDTNCKVTEEGENLLKNATASIKTEICYLFYDYNRGIILNTKCGANDVSFYETNNYRFELISDATDEQIRYKRINIKRIPVDERNIELAIKNSKLASKELILKDINVIDIDHKTYDLIGYGETNIKDTKGSRWKIYNPISFEIDHNLQNYFYSQIQNESVRNYIQSLMSVRLTNSYQKEDEKIYDLVRTKLFNPEIKQKHLHFVDSFVSVIKSISINSNTEGYNEYLYNSSLYKTAVLNLAQLYENVLYQAVVENIDKVSLDNLCNNSSTNRAYFKECATKLGFYIDDNVANLFTLEKRTLSQVMKKPNAVKIDNVIALNLLIAETDKNYYFNKLAKNDPNFIVRMYEFKKEDRNSQRHTTSVKIESIEENVDLLFMVFELAFGYKVNMKEYKSYISSENQMYDYSYVHEYVRSKIPNIFNSNNTRCSNLKTNFIELYKNFMWEKPNYAANARTIAEDIIKFILIDQTEKFDLKLDKKDIEQYKTAQNFKDKISSLGFNVDINNQIGSKLEGALDVDIKTYNNIFNGQFNGYAKTNLRFKLQGLVIILDKFDSVKKLFLKDGSIVAKNLFTTVAEIMYIDKKHQQNEIFDKKIAEIIIEDLFEITNELLNHKSIINLG